MQTSSIFTTAGRAGGAVVFWKIGNATLRGSLHEALEILGYGHLTPDLRTANAVLKDALVKYFRPRKMLIRPLEGEGYAVVAESRGHEENEYTQTRTARVKHRIVTIAPVYNQYETAPVQALFNGLSSLLTSQSVASCMAKVIEALGGTPLRPKGAVYWVPADQLDTFSQVARVVEKASFKGDDTSIYIMRTLYDNDAVRAVKDGVTAEISGEVERVEREIETCTLGQDALRNRMHQMDRMRAKLKGYEESLGVLMGTLHESLERVETAAANGLLQQAAAF